METIIFATGISKLDANIMASLTEKAGPDAYKEVGYATHLDTLVEQCKQKRPSIVVIRDGLQGKTDFLETLRRLKTEIPDIRIIVITKDRPVGDSLLVSLTIYNIYDFIAAESVKGSQIADLIINPKTYADIEQYVPVISRENEAKYSFETKTVVDRGVHGGDALGDISVAENDPGLTEDISGDRAYSAGKDLGAIIFEGVDETDESVFKSPLRRTSTVPSGSKLGYRPIFSNVVNGLRRKKSEDEKMTVNLSSQQAHKAYDLPETEPQKFVEPEEIKPEINPAIPEKEETFTTEVTKTAPKAEEEIPVEEVIEDVRDVFVDVPEVKAPETPAKPIQEPVKETVVRNQVEEPVEKPAEEPVKKEIVPEKAPKLLEKQEDIVAKVQEAMAVFEEFLKNNSKEAQEKKEQDAEKLVERVAEKPKRHAKKPVKPILNRSDMRFITFLKPFGNENTTALNVAVSLAMKFPGQVAFVLAKDPTDRCVYDGMFKSEGGVLKLANDSDEDPIRMAIIGATNDGLAETLSSVSGFRFVVVETMDPEVLTYVNDVVLDVPQDRFLLDVIKDVLIEDVKKKNFLVVIPQFSSETGLREKTIRRFLGIPGEKLVCLNDELHLNGTAFHTKAPYFINNDEKAKEYMAPLMEKLGF